ncbi:hypothetical protein [Clostridium sp.]|uniref:hypothetical protein n=1 Tax=Clostridium sp. TaxID=1506 RepID=UPI00262A8AA6|nr:hypothetical protein [Clostridium sp.]
MYIDLNVIYLILAILGCVAVVYLILTLNKILKLLTNVNSILDQNKDNLSRTIADLPSIANNVNDACQNIKDISEVATETTADLIVAKENIETNVETVREIAKIISQVFLKR